MRYFVSLLCCVLFVGVSFTSAFADVKIKERTKYYNVTGTTGAQIFKSIVRRTPLKRNGSHAIAFTSGNFDVKNIKVEARGNRCKITNSTVVISITYTYPRWKGYKRGSPELRKRWDNFMKLLIRHEEKHGKIFVDGARGFDRSMRRATGRISKDCNDLGKSFERHIKPVALSTNRRQVAFDRREGFRWAKVRIAERLLHGTD